MANGHGGKREGSGRKPAHGQELSAGFQRYVEKKYKQTPLDFLMSIVDDVKQDIQIRVDCAKAALPYCHPRLAHIHMTGRVEHGHEHWLESIDSEVRPALDMSDADFQEIPA